MLKGKICTSLQAWKLLLNSIDFEGRDKTEIKNSVLENGSLLLSGYTTIGCFEQPAKLMFLYLIDSIHF